VINIVVNDAFLEDLHSTNGTFVNGAAIKRHFLQDGDVIELGKYRLKYLSEASHAAAQPDFEKTVLLRPEMMRHAAEDPQVRTGEELLRAGAMPAGTASAVAGVPPGLSFERTQPPIAQEPVLPGRAMIQILTGSNAGKELELTKPLTSIGKPGVQVAVIARRPQGYFMTHVEGAVLPVIRGKRLEPDKPFELQDHDVIEFGGIKMEFFYRP
jgi:hypothetical protein